MEAASIDDADSSASLTLMLADGRLVSYAVFGDPKGRPVLALHGAPASRLMFKMADGPARSAGLKLIAPDRPGYAGTPADEQPTLGGRAAWLIAIADALELSRFAVLGISGGAPYATAVAAQAGQRVTGLALVSPMGPLADLLAAPSARAPEVPFLQRRFFLHLGQRRWLTHPVARAIAGLSQLSSRSLLVTSDLLAGQADAAILRDPEVRGRLEAMLADAFRNGGTGGASDLWIYGQPWRVDYSAIVAPSILWQGTADTIVPVLAARYLARVIPGCRYIELPGAGHFWVIRHIAEVLGEIARLEETGT